MPLTPDEALEAGIEASILIGLALFISFSSVSPGTIDNGEFWGIVLILLLGNLLQQLHEELRPQLRWSIDNIIKWALFVAVAVVALNAGAGSVFEPLLRPGSILGPLLRPITGG